MVMGYCALSVYARFTLLQARRESTTEARRRRGLGLGLPRVEPDGRAGPHSLHFLECAIEVHSAPSNIGDAPSLAPLRELETRIRASAHFATSAQFVLGWRWDARFARGAIDIKHNYCDFFVCGESLPEQTGKHTT